MDWKQQWARGRMDRQGPKWMNEWIKIKKEQVSFKSTAKVLGKGRYRSETWPAGEKSGKISWPIGFSCEQDSDMWIWDDLHPGKGEWVKVLEKGLLWLDGVIYSEARDTWKEGCSKDGPSAHHRGESIWSPSYTIPLRLTRIQSKCFY